MSFKTVITFTRDVRRDRDTLSMAASVAREDDGHLSVVSLGIDRIQPGAYYAGANAVALQQSLEQAQSEADEAEREAREFLAGETLSWDVAGMALQIGSLSHVVASRAQFTDLVVLSKPYGDSRGPEDVAILESALFGTRVPVLVVPPGASGPIRAEKAMVCWNQSTEALAAIRAALPLLARAKTVDICIIDPPSHGPDRSDPGGVLAEMLARHGVRADISVLAKTMPRISDVIVRHCADVEADLVVMGAYGHSRLREAILGGATRNMLETAQTPILMAH